jgi:uncharacterized protein (DUF488 family)
MERKPDPTVFTVGHSTRSAGEFVRLLQRHGILQVADVRTVPRSRRNPQFNRGILPQTLAAAGIGYTHLPALGGFRRPLPDSPNSGWENESFRGFADYMLTEAFQDGLEKLLALAREKPTAVMCAEALPWRCHRSLIADALHFRGIPVEDILDPVQRRPHRVTPFARWDGKRLTYPAPGGVAPA